MKNCQVFIYQSDLWKKYPHPYYWVAFVLTGDSGKTLEVAAIHQGPPSASQRENSNVSVTLSILCCLGIGALVFLVTRKEVSEIWPEAVEQDFSSYDFLSYQSSDLSLEFEAH